MLSAELAMSLFKARDWWSTTSGFEEFHDLGSLCAANIDNSPNGYGMHMHAACRDCMPSGYGLLMNHGLCSSTTSCLVDSDKLIVGSFQGLVRIYEPHPPAFSADHVILEQQMTSPVLQVAAGQFVQ